MSDRPSLKLGLILVSTDFSSVVLSCFRIQ